MKKLKRSFTWMIGALIVAAVVYAADTKISALTAVSSVIGAQEFAVNDAGTSKKASATQIQTFLGATKISLTSSATANATTTGVEITDLQATLVAGTYVFEYHLIYQSAATTTGVKFGVNYTGTATAIVAHMLMQTQATAASDGTHDQATGAEGIVFGYTTRTATTTAPNLGPSENVDTINANMYTLIRGIVVVSGGGDLELWHASEVAASSQVMAGSSLILHRTN